VIALVGQGLLERWYIDRVDAGSTEGNVLRAVKGAIRQYKVCASIAGICRDKPNRQHATSIRSDFRARAKVSGDPEIPRLVSTYLRAVDVKGFRAGVRYGQYLRWCDPPNDLSPKIQVVPVQGGNCLRLCLRSVCGIFPRQRAAEQK
jgi:hypothetical protein